MPILYLQNAILRCILLILVIVFTQQSYAEKYPRNPLTSLSLQVSPAFEAEYDTVFDIGLTLEYKNGKRRKTRGFNKGSKSWNKFEVKVNHGHFNNGKITFNRSDVLETRSKTLVISITPKRQPDFIKEFQITIPFIQSITLGYDSTSNLVPGYEIPYWINAEYSSGKVFYSKNHANKIMASEPARFHISLADYIIDSPDPLVIKEKSVMLPLTDSMLYSSIILRAQHKAIDSLKNELQIPINYRAKYFLNYYGVPGNHGYHGYAGYDRSVGDGDNGYDGGNGDNGQDGMAIEIFAIDQFIWNKDTLVYVAVESSEGIETLIVDAKKGKIHVQCKGGDGGNGGNGGSGGDGGDETLEYEAGWGGNGGNGGNGGDGGNGSNVTFYTSAELGFDTSLFVIDNHGGRAGIGGTGGAKGRGGAELDDEDEAEDRPLLLSIIKAITDVVLTFNNGENGKSGHPGKSGKKGKLVLIEEFKKSNELEGTLKDH